MLWKKYPDLLIGEVGVLFLLILNFGKEENQDYMIEYLIQKILNQNGIFKDYNLENIRIILNL
jgi:hypothetical protein